MVSPDLQPQACWEFEGEILVLHHPTTISSRYQAMVHCGSIRQTASIVNMSKECLRTGDKAHVKFRFIKHPEYIRPGQRMVFREGRTKAVGNVLKPITNSVAVQHRPKPNKMQARGQGQGGGQGQGHSHGHNQPQNQNHNPNVQAAATSSKHQQSVPEVDMKQNMEGVLEMSVDKRDVRGGKRTKRGSSHNPIAGVTVGPGGSGGSGGSTNNDQQSQTTNSHITAKVQ